MGDATHLSDILGELALKYLATASILRIVLMVTKLVNSLSATGHGSKSLCDMLRRSILHAMCISTLLCPHRMFQIRKASITGGFSRNILCGQGESNSRLILGKDVLYHLTMPAVSVLRQKLWRQYRVLEQIVQLAICHRQNCDTERD